MALGVSPEVTPVRPSSPFQLVPVAIAKGEYNIQFWRHSKREDCTVWMGSVSQIKLKTLSLQELFIKGKKEGEGERKSLQRISYSV